MARIPTKETIKRATIKDMKALGTHKPQYNRLIDIYADLVNQYLTAIEEFEEGGRQYEVSTAAGGFKKSPIVATLENLRKDILQYSDRLMLNPKAFDQTKIEVKTESKLDRLLESFGES